MNNELSFAAFNMLTDNIAEIIVNNDVILTLEMLDEYDEFLEQKIKSDFGLLVNMINNYSFTTETEMVIGSWGNLKACAVVYYNNTAKEITENALQRRSHDDLNVKLFSGLNLGWHAGFDWLKLELEN